MNNDKVLRMLARVLRHRVNCIELEVSPDGWVDLEAVVQSLNVLARDLGHWLPISTANVLELLDATDAWNRFEVGNGCIRALYGHSLPHVITGIARPPPTVLLHGTSQCNASVIRRDGLEPKRRRFVHLTSDQAYAAGIAEQSAISFVVVVNAREAWRSGIEFRQATRHVWLSDAIPAGFLNPAGLICQSSATPQRRS